MYGESRSELPLRDFVRWVVLNLEIRGTAKIGIQPWKY